MFKVVILILLRVELQAIIFGYVAFGYVAFGYSFGLLLWVNAFGCCFRLLLWAIAFGYCFLQCCFRPLLSAKTFGYCFWLKLSAIAFGFICIWSHNNMPKQKDIRLLIICHMSIIMSSGWPDKSILSLAWFRLSISKEMIFQIWVGTDNSWEAWISISSGYWCIYAMVGPNCFCARSNSSLEM